MYPGQDIDLLVLLVQEILQVLHFCLQGTHALLQRLRITAGKSSAAQLVARSALEAHVGALCTARSNTVAADLLASASVTGLGDPALAAGAADLDHFHR